MKYAFALHAVIRRPEGKREEVKAKTIFQVTEQEFADLEKIGAVRVASDEEVAAYKAKAAVSGEATSTASAGVVSNAAEAQEAGARTAEQSRREAEDAETGDAGSKRGGRGRAKREEI